MASSLCISVQGWLNMCVENLLVACTKLTEKEVKDATFWLRNWDRPSKVGWNVGCSMEKGTGKD